MDAHHGACSHCVCAPVQGVLLHGEADVTALLIKCKHDIHKVYM